MSALRDALRSSVFLEDALQKLRAAKTDAELRVCAALIDGPECQALPFKEQQLLARTYSDACFRVSGAMI